MLKPDKSIRMIACAITKIIYVYWIYITDFAAYYSYCYADNQLELAFVDILTILNHACCAS